MYRLSKAQPSKEQVDIVVLASHLARIGYEVVLRTAIGGGIGQQCFRNLSNEFLVVSAPFGSEAKDIIIDLKFREQFGLARQSFRYMHLLSLLPRSYIGQPSQLRALVRFLTSEMKAVFKEADITLPPWRECSSVMSKWNPKMSRDIEIYSSSSSASPRGLHNPCTISRSSACRGGSSDHFHHVVPEFSQRVSMPKTCQAGFSVYPSHASSTGDAQLPGKGCNIHAPFPAPKTVSAGVLKLGMQVVEDRKLGLAKIRSVRMGRSK